MPQRAAYASSKHGVIGLTKQMAVELGPHKIRINVVAPGVVRTELTERYFDDPKVVESLRISHPLGHTGETSDVSAAILFLASQDASYITGAVLSVDGGFIAGKPLW